MLKGFSADGRDLTDKETKAFLAAADKDGDGKIGIDGERTSTLKGTVPLKHYKTQCLKFLKCKKLSRVTKICNRL